MDRKTFLNSVYSDFKETEEYKKLYKSFPLIGVASKLNIALAGSTAIHVTAKKAKRVAGDLDFVTDSSEKAMSFISKILELYKKYNWHGRILIQNKTKFCFEGTSQHYKIFTSFGVNICIMVLDSPINYWYNEVGICIQKINDIVKYMSEAKDRDKKDRPEIENKENC
ncbi:hypothetical protein [Shewanella sp.]|jgi:hypothetical protein|uniref:hypothetical protein n=1 Tax=Shewanella sp. TaxID=50422 RepID=UPI003562B21B